MALALTVTTNLVGIFTVSNVVSIALFVNYFLMTGQAKLSVQFVGLFKSFKATSADFVELAMYLVGALFDVIMTLKY